MKDICYDPMVIAARSTVKINTWRGASEFERLPYGLQRLEQVLKYADKTCMQGGIQDVAREAGGILGACCDTRKPSRGYLKAMTHKHYLQDMKEMDDRVLSVRDEMHYLAMKRDGLTMKIDELEREACTVERGKREARPPGFFHPEVALQSNIQFDKDLDVMRGILQEDASVADTASGIKPDFPKQEQ